MSVHLMKFLQGRVDSSPSYLRRRAHTFQSTILESCINHNVENRPNQGWMVDGQTAISNWAPVPQVTTVVSSISLVSLPTYETKHPLLSFSYVLRSVGLVCKHAPTWVSALVSSTLPLQSIPGPSRYESFKKLILHVSIFLIFSY